MIGSGLKKLANQHGMTVSGGVAYGSLRGYATTLSEGAGWKRIDISTQFSDAGQKEQLQAAVNAVDISRQYRVQSIEIYARTISIVFLDNPGTMKKIEAFIEWFYPLLAQYGAVGANVCLECGGEVAAGEWYLVNGVAHHLHESCAAHIQSELDTDEQQRKDEDTGSYVQGFLGALGGAILGAVVWAIVLYVGYVASIVGFVIGWLAEKGYNLLHGKQGKGKITILIIAIIVGVLLGSLVPDAIAVVQLIDAGELPGCTYADIPLIIIFTMMENSEYLTATLGNMGLGLLFAALGVFALLKKTSQEVTGPKMKKLG